MAKGSCGQQTASCLGTMLLSLGNQIRTAEADTVHGDDVVADKLYDGVTTLLSGPQDQNLPFGVSSWVGAEQDLTRLPWGLPSVHGQICVFVGKTSP